MERILFEKLEYWKTQKNRKPLILWGARQVGKTWLMKEFGKRSFKSFLYISFYNNLKTSRIFEPDYDVKRIISELEIQYKTKIIPDETLLIFDEIQAAPKVLESLKYFCEEVPEYAIICAGSLLGVSIHEDVSFPVGKVNELRLYPMSFSEYLLAMGENQLSKLLLDYKNPMTSQLKEEYIKHLKNYYFVGGMPECVLAFSERKDYDEVREIQNEILSQYEGDFGKHIEPKELPRIRMTWNAIPVQLAKENKKYFFGKIKEGARMKDFEIALQWLCDAGLIYKINKVTKPAIPLKSYVEFSSFKIYMLDIGLLSAFSELDKETILNGNDVFVEFKGALTEQYVLQELMSSTEYSPYYYSGDKSTYETDFLIQKEKYIIPIEVKAEKILKSKSLKVFCDYFQTKYAIRISMADYADEGWLVNVPLWCVEGM